MSIEQTPFSTSQFSDDHQDDLDKNSIWEFPPAAWL
jgi:hypothetical protein